MGAKSTSDTNETAASASKTGPDWTQFVLVIVAVLVLSLAAISFPALGGVAGDAGPSAAGSESILDLADSGNESEEGSESMEASQDGEHDSDELDEQDGEGGDVGDGEESDDGGYEGDRGDEPEGGDRIEDEAGESDEGGDEPGDDERDEAVEEGDEFDDGAAPEDGLGREPGDGEFDDERGDEFDRDDESAADDADTEPTGDGEADEGDDRSDDSTATDEPDSNDEANDESTTDDDDEADDETEERDDETETDATNGYDISFDEQPTPGREVEVTVTDGGEPLPDARVSFNGDPIGVTDGDGTVTGAVPFTETLTVTVDPQGRTAAAAQETAEHGAVGAIPPGTSSSAIQFYGGSAPFPIQEAEHSDAESETDRTEERDGDDTGAERTVEMDAETSLELDRAVSLEDDDAVLGGTNATVTGEVEGTPIPSGTVMIDGEAVATTNESGAARISIPETPGNATVAVERADIRAERSVAIHGLSLEVVERVPLPGRTVDVAVEYAGPAADDADAEGDEDESGTETNASDAPRAVENATLLVDGNEVTTTGADGTATVALPVANDATIGAQVNDATAETAVTGLYRNAALIALGALALVSALGWLVVRRLGVTRATVRSLPGTLRRLVRRAGELAHELGRRAVDAVVRVARYGERIGGWLVDRGLAALRALRRAGRWLLALPGELAEKGLAALAALHPARLYEGLLAAIRSLRRSSREQVAELTADRRSGGMSGESSAEPEQQVRTLRELWHEFVRAVRPPRIRTKTPGEIGRHAVEKGFPEPPVRTVVDAFRDAEYGESTPSSSRLDRVQTAVRSVSGSESDDPAARTGIGGGGDPAGADARSGDETSVDGTDDGDETDETDDANGPKGASGADGVHSMTRETSEAETTRADGAEEERP